MWHVTEGKILNTSHFCLSFVLPGNLNPIAPVYSKDFLLNTYLRLLVRCHLSLSLKRENIYHSKILFFRLWTQNKKSIPWHCLILSSFNFTSLTSAFWGFSPGMTALRLRQKVSCSEQTDSNDIRWPEGLARGAARSQLISPRLLLCSEYTSHTSHPSAWWLHVAKSTSVSGSVRCRCAGFWTSSPAPSSDWCLPPERRSVLSICWPRYGPPAALSASLWRLWPDTQSALSILSGLKESARIAVSRTKRTNTSIRHTKTLSHSPLNLEGSVLGLRPVTWV